MARLRDVEVPQDYLDAVEFDAAEISDEFKRLSADRAYWNEIYANAFRAALKARAELDRSKAKVALSLRAEAALKGEKVTEALIEAKVATHEDVIAAVEAHIEAETERERMRGRLTALQDKKEGITAYGRQLLEEMRGDPTMRAQSTERAGWVTPDR